VPTQISNHPSSGPSNNASMLTMCQNSQQVSQPLSASTAALATSFGITAHPFQLSFDPQFQNPNFQQQQLINFQPQQQIFPNQQIVHAQYSTTLPLTLGTHPTTSSSSSPEVISGSTPLSAIAANTCPAPPETNIEQRERKLIVH
jgi:hypothetical protein